jgi:hypothetical protein
MAFSSCNNRYVSKSLLSTGDNQYIAHFEIILHQLLKLISRLQFEALEKYDCERRKSDTFPGLNQFAQWIILQYTGRAGVRGRIRSMILKTRNFYHVDAKSVLRLGFAHSKKHSVFFSEFLFEKDCRCCSLQSKKHKIKLKNNIYSLDATGIVMCVDAFPRTSFRHAKAEIKVNTLLDHSGCFKQLARNIAYSHKERSQIVKFFYWIKKNLKIISFIGNYGVPP